MAKVRLSVRKIVEFILRSGDIDSRFRDSSAVYLGAAAHRKIQGEADENYAKEVTLKYETNIGDISVVVQGRADGIITGDNGGFVIDEIKSTTKPLQLFFNRHNEHLAQGKCYAYMYMKTLKNIPEVITVRLTYFQLKTEEINRHEWDFTPNDLEAFFLDLLNKYAVWLRLELEWKTKRDESITSLDFPYESYRKGQRELAIAGYRAITAGRKLYASAPTGIGKTISTVFPSVKALGSDSCEKIFYFSAKTLTRGIAEDAIRLMISKGLRLRSVTLRAKDKLCPNNERICTPDYCKFAKGHFDRVNDAVYSLVSENDLINAEKTLEYALIHQVCPYELSLDAALWCDFIIGDYNHLFDPFAYLRRFFDNPKSKYIFLVDEAHNLADRVRDMHSPTLKKSEISRILRRIRGRDTETKDLRRALKGLQSYLTGLGEGKSNRADADQDMGLKELIEAASVATEVWLLSKTGNSSNQEQGAKNAFIGDMPQDGSAVDNSNSDVLEFYFDIVKFLHVSQVYDECFTTVIEVAGSDVFVTLFCIDPSGIIAAGLNRGKGSVLFSATLTPLNYYCEMLGGSEEDFIISLPSPFDPTKLKTISHIGISTKYTQRNESYTPIAQTIAKAVSDRIGNYMVFFPSYEYLRQVYESFSVTAPYVKTLVQKSDMDEVTRSDFLSKFEENSTETLVGFTVLGGIFSEGIDLKGDRLIGAIIVSVGIPMISFRRNLMRDYFEKKNGKGYDYAYVYPGMNKVLQAAGRVIRSESDSGIVLLIDSRYNEPKYRGLFPDHWTNMQYIKSCTQTPL